MRFERKWTTCIVHAIRDVAPAIREFVLRPEEFSVTNYAPGSHVNVSVLIDGRPETRCYSLVGDVSPDGYRIAVRRAPDSRGGSRYMWSLKPGARIEVSSPASLFEIDWSRKSYCLIAGGIGITPIIGISSALMRRNAEVELQYAVRKRHGAAGRRPDACRPICATRHLAQAAFCRRHRFGSGSTIPAGRSWFPKTNQCWMRSTRPA